MRISPKHTGAAARVEATTPRPSPGERGPGGAGWAMGDTIMRWALHGGTLISNYSTMISS